MTRYQIALGCCFFVIGCSSQPELVVTRESVGEDWPYPKTSSAIIKCQNRNEVIIEINGVEYGLNGKAQRAGFEPSQKQMETNDDGIVENTGPIEWVKKGLELCSK